MTEPAEIARSVRGALARSSPRDRARQRIGAVDVDDRDARRDRAEDVDQLGANGSAAAAVGRAGPARRRQGDPRRARRNRERRDPRRRGRRAPPSVPAPRRRHRRSSPARADSGVGPARLPQERVGQQGVGDVRVAPGGRRAGRRPARGDLGADPGPERAPAGGRRRVPHQHDRLRRADTDEPRGARRAPAALRQPDRHERAGTAVPALPDGRAPAGVVPDRAADAQPHRRRRHPFVRRHAALRAVGAIGTRSPTSKCSRAASKTRSPKC